MKVRRGKSVFVHQQERRQVDLGALLRGKIEQHRRAYSVAACPLVGEELELSQNASGFLARLSADEWADLGEQAPEDIEKSLPELIAKGLVITDRDQEPDATLRALDDRTRQGGWDKYALLYHGMSRWEDAPEGGAETLESLAAASDQGLRELVDEQAPPAAAYRPAESLEEIELPEAPASGALFELLQERATVRVFDDVPVALDAFSTLLRTVWGASGVSRPFAGLELLKKTSPSGGALHPTEVFPLVLNVDGLDPGVYHYGAADHRLRRLKALDAASARELANDISAGQLYPRDAGALFLMTSRLERCFWKYRDHSKAYKVALLDVGHLSQTFYLTCTALGLGPFFSAAINDRCVTDLLDLDGFDHAPVAICGCGVPARSGLNLGLRVEPKILTR